MTGICPHCFRVVRLTKHNTCYRHGYRSHAANKNWRGEFLGSGFGMVESKSACPGSGKSRLTPLAVDACPFCVAGFDPNFEGFVPCTACDGTGRATKA